MAWKTKDGRIMEMCEMSEEHIANSIKYCEKNGDYKSAKAVKEERTRRIKDTSWHKCPFCGGEMKLSRIREEAPEFGVFVPEYNLHCSSCGAFSPRVKIDEEKWPYQKAVDLILPKNAKPRQNNKPQTIGEKYPCPQCGSTKVIHTMTYSFCPDCDYDSKKSDLAHPMDKKPSKPYRKWDMDYDEPPF